MRMNLNHVASGHFVLGETFFVSSIIGHCPLAVSMPPTKVCPQCKAAVPVRQKSERCNLVFRSKRKAECNLREKTVYLTMKHMGAVESDSVKSARKAKDKLHKACERAPETHEPTLHGQEQNNAHAKHERVTKQCLASNQHTKYNHMHCCAEGLALQCLSLLYWSYIPYPAPRLLSTANFFIFWHP